jgi:hypothetical protein
MKDAQGRARHLLASTRMQKQNRRAAMLRRSVQEVNPGDMLLSIHKSFDWRTCSRWPPKSPKIGGL